jgi:hypothetical protein
MILQALAEASGRPINIERVAMIDLLLHDTEGLVIVAPIVKHVSSETGETIAVYSLWRRVDGQWRESLIGGDAGLAEERAAVIEELGRRPGVALFVVNTDAEGLRLRAEFGAAGRA